GALDEERPLLADAVDEILDLPLVAFDLDVHGRRRAGAHRGALAHGADLRILGLLDAEIPARDVVVFHDDGAILAADLDAARPARPGGGGAFDGAERAARELQRGDAGVLGFDPMHALRGP